MKKIKVYEKLETIKEYWQPRILGEVNDTHIKLVKLKGEFLWHVHENEDEMFFVLKGELMIKFRDQDIILNEGESLVIPKGVEHMPVADSEVHVMLIEPKTTVNTGNIKSERTFSPVQL